MSLHFSAPMLRLQSHNDTCGGSSPVFVARMTDEKRDLLVIKHNTKLIFMMTRKKRTP